MNGPAVDVVVVIPAHNEAATIDACLTSVDISLTEARRRSWAGRTLVVVGVHRCNDDTERIARAAVSADELLVVVEDTPMPVGVLRTRLVEAAYETLGHAEAWIFSTDADTVVPADWVAGILAVAAQEDADLVLGLADLSDWDADAQAQTDYRTIIEAGLTPTGHRHAYAANLAVRLDAFRQVGGFPGAVHGEEHELARAVRAAGLRVSTPLQPRVLTSARMPGRAAHGLGSLLDTLAQHIPREDIS